MKIVVKSMLLISIVVPSLAFAQDEWRGLRVTEEHRCSPYNKSEQYPYPQSVEDKVVEAMGGIVYGPYTGSYFSSDSYTDIEHIVAASEGHDSGLCNASSDKRKQFATDPLNLTLAAPEINRCGDKGKCGKDAAEWMPPKNKCWFANRIVEVKLKYTLSVDRAEAKALEMVLSNCDSTAMVFFPKQVNADTSSLSSDNALALYDDNGNGFISCSEAKKHAISPVHQGHPAYVYMRDSDRDGVVCE
ncbi:excalibur calcium-binding domain-containing protein [Vibrio tubiashii]|uniref:excalibur calcium-binding domain-containing protein n=1 Tax=Vibrio tubiashii TaxID=29498 RepID=UPI001EFE9A44|nr:DUF1524 domain-containing protein [Vibrio tubiashii]MCG9576097.1 excalibur calcium-binding domain-containing protein [Vibrio tubiashii]